MRWQREALDARRAGPAAPSCPRGRRRTPRPCPARAPPPARAAPRPSHVHEAAPAGARAAAHAAISQRGGPGAGSSAGPASSRASSGFSGKAHREDWQRLAPLARGRARKASAPQAPARATAPSRAAAGRPAPARPGGARSGGNASAALTGVVPRGKRNLLCPSASATSTDWWAPPTTTAGSRRATSPPRRHEGKVSNPREAALQGLEKMRFVSGLGVGQAVLPPQPRPSLRTLRALGFGGTRRGGAGPGRRARTSTCSASARAPRRCGRPTPPPPLRRATPATAGCTSPWPTSRRCSTG